MLERYTYKKGKGVNNNYDFLHRSIYLGWYLRRAVYDVPGRQSVSGLGADDVISPAGERGLGVEGHGSRANRNTTV